MKIKKVSKKPSKKTILLSSAGLIILAFCYGAYAIKTNTWPFSERQDISKTQVSGKKTPEKTPANSGFATEDTGSETITPKTPAENAPAPPPAKDSVGVTITSIHDEGGAVKIHTLIETITSQGECTLTFEKDGKKITKTAGIQALSSSSTCKGFKIPASELSPGIWQVSLYVDIGEKTGLNSRKHEVK